MSYQIYMNKIFFVVACILATAVIYVNANNGPIEILQTLIQNNVVGPPVIHQITKWDFDPNDGVKRRELFQRVHGFRGEKLVERLGLGVDGHHAARLAQQQARDDGLLGGTIFQLKSGLNTIDRV